MFCILCVVCAVAQEKSDSQTSAKKLNFSGTWIPQVEKESKPLAGSKDWTNVIISQSEQEIKFTLVYPPASNTPTREFKYFIDERGETNEGLVYYYLIANAKESEKQIKSKTKFDGQTLVTTHKIIFLQNLLTMNMDLTMRWELSADGKTLSRTTKMSNHTALYNGKTLPVSGPVDSGSKDTYMLLEEKQ